VDEKILALWNKNKIFFFLLLPILLLILFRNVVFDILVGISRKTMENARKEDAKLKEIADTAKEQSQDLEEKAKEIQDTINNRTTNDIPEDWYKKK
jgi:uncharacterized protein YlxW (UPF0749 family)